MINSNFGFTPLREVWLGDCYPESFYDHLPNEIADPFRQITEWTKQDLNRLQKFLESRNIIVQRPQFDSIDTYLDKFDALIKPPICPRDDYLVLSNTLYYTEHEVKKNLWHHITDQYIAKGYAVKTPNDFNSLQGVCPPSVVRMGRDIYIDPSSHDSDWKAMCEVAVEWGKDYRVNICNTSGHADGVFCPIKPGLIATTHYKKEFSQSFPDWKIYALSFPKSNYDSVPGKTWQVHASIDNNAAFGNFIVQYAKNWIGNFTETVFEVNMLVLDESNVVCMKEHPPFFKFLEAQGITAHVFDFRCRSFWDGGWHCLTLDIDRDDFKADLFPDRGDNGVYWRIK